MARDSAPRSVRLSARARARAKEARKVSPPERVRTERMASPFQDVHNKEVLLGAGGGDFGAGAEAQGVAVFGRAWRGGGAGFGEARQRLLLDPGDELVGLEVVGQGLGEGRFLVEGGALFHQGGGADQGLLGRLDFVGESGDFRLGGRGVSLALAPLGLDDVGFVFSDWRREELGSSRLSPLACPRRTELSSRALSAATAFFSSSCRRAWRTSRWAAAAATSASSLARFWSISFSFASVSALRFFAASRVWSSPWTARDEGLRTRRSSGLNPAFEGAATARPCCRRSSPCVSLRPANWAARSARPSSRLRSGEMRPRSSCPCALSPRASRPSGSRRRGLPRLAGRRFPGTVAHDLLAHGAGRRRARGDAAARGPRGRRCKASALGSQPCRPRPAPVRYRLSRADRLLHFGERLRAARGLAARSARALSRRSRRPGSQVRELLGPRASRPRGPRGACVEPEASSRAGTSACSVRSASLRRPASGEVLRSSGGRAPPGHEVAAMASRSRRAVATAAPSARAPRGRPARFSACWLRRRRSASSDPASSSAVGEASLKSPASWLAMNSASRRASARGGSRSAACPRRRRGSRAPPGSCGAPWARPSRTRRTGPGEARPSG